MSGLNKKQEETIRMLDKKQLKTEKSEYNASDYELDPRVPNYSVSVDENILSGDPSYSASTKADGSPVIANEDKRFCHEIPIDNLEKTLRENKKNINAKSRL